jgi:hypothetical protein
MSSWQTLAVYLLSMMLLPQASPSLFKIIGRSGDFPQAIFSGAPGYQGIPPRQIVAVRPGDCQQWRVMHDWPRRGKSAPALVLPAKMLSRMFMCSTGYSNLLNCRVIFLFCY